MRWFGCFPLILVAFLLFGAGYFSARQTVTTFEEQPALVTTPTATPVWATFPSSAATPYPVDAIYQPFERGFMLWRADFNCVYAIQTDLPDSPHRAIIPLVIPGADNPMIHSYGYCLSVAPLTDRVIVILPPIGLLVPRGALGKVWSCYDEVRLGLGLATASEQRYTATVPTNQGAAIMDGSPFTMAQMTLPDGTVLACGSRGATAGTC